MDQAAVRTGQYNSVSMISAGVYEGQVTAVDMTTRTADVKVNGVEVKGCSYFPLFFASFIGVSCNYFPPVGSIVTVLYTAGRSYILGARAMLVDRPKMYKGRVAGDPDAETQVSKRQAYKKGKRGKAKKGATTGGHFPQGDMFPGEVEISDNMGTALRVLYGLAQLTSGEQAKVETSLMNDMVRITDNYFAHHMAGGDTLSWTWGKYASMEEHFTGHQFEADGKEDKDKPLTEKMQSGAYKSKDAPGMKSRFSDTGRWRKSTYTGFLGDMIHTFVTQPTKVISSTMDGAARPGLYRSWVGSDGTLMIQAAGGVHVEVTSRDIYVPEIKYAWNDPELVEKLEGQLENLDAQYDKLWGSGPKWDDLNVACWQMGAYLRYITYFHSMARWHQLAKTGYCKVPKPGDTDPAEATNGDKDREKNCPQGKYPYVAQSSFSIDPSGSITAQSNGLVSMVMNNGNLQLSAIGNIEINAGNTVSISGRYLSLRSLFEMEIVSVLGKVTQKAKTAFKLFCEKGRLWLKSDASEETKDWKASKDDDDNDVEFAKHAIVIEASKGSIVSSAEKSNVLSSNSDDNYGDEGAEEEYSESRARGVVIQGKRINLRSDGTVYMYAKNLAASFVTATTVVKTMFMECAALSFSKLFKLVGGILKGGSLKLKVGSVMSQGGFTGPSTAVNASPAKVLKEEVKLEEDELEAHTEAMDVLGKEVDGFSAKDYVEEEFKDGPESQWRFRKWKVGSSVAKWAAVKRSPVWTTAKFGKVAESSALEEVNWTELSKPEGKNVSQDQVPWPGADASEFYYNMSYGDTLGMGMTTPFEAGHIGGADAMQSEKGSVSFVVKSGMEDTDIIKQERK